MPITESNPPPVYPCLLIIERDNVGADMRRGIQFDIEVDGFRVPCVASAEAVAYALQAGSGRNSPASDDNKTEASLKQLKHEATRRFLRGATPPVIVLHEHLYPRSR